MLRISSWVPALGAVLLLVVACGQEPPHAPDRKADLRPLPDLPDQDLLDAPVRVQFRIRDQRIRDLLAAPDPSDEQLARAFGELGMLYLAYEYLEPAAACLSNARRLAPDSARWTYFAGLAQMQLGRLEAADELFEVVVRLDPRHTAALTRIADNALARGNFDRADTHFSRAIEADRTNARAMLGRAQVAMEREQLSRAEDFLEQARALQPLAAEIQHTLGLIYRERGDHERARAHFEEARRSRAARDSVTMADPFADELDALRQGSRAHDQRAVEAILTGDVESAIAEYRLALAADPDAHDIRYNLALILLQRGRRAEGLEEFQTLLERAPDHVPTLMHLGYEYTLDSRLDEAETYIRHAIDVDPYNLDARLLLGDFLEHTGRYPEAAEAYEQSLDINPNLEQAYVGAAISRARAGQTERALETVMRGLAVFPDSNALDQLRQQLTPAR